MGILDVGVSGLLATQQALATTGHNISNANTPGYSRQRVALAALEPQLAGGSYLGKGVGVASIQRVYDGFLTAQVRAAGTNVGELQAYQFFATQMDDLLANPESGLAPAIQNFFNAVQDVANDPASAPARQALLSQANVLSERFHTLSGQLDQLRIGHAQRVRDGISEVNSLADSIAELNSRIVTAKGSASGTLPSDLLDQRDELVRQLSEKVGVSVIDNDDSSISIMVGSGQALVLGSTTRPLGAMANPYDPARLEVGYDTGAGLVEISSLISGGELGGLLQVREQILDPAQNALGRIAVVMSDTFNAQHQLGMHLDPSINGGLGADFFTNLSSGSEAVPVIRDHQANTGSGVLQASISDATALTTSDYQIDYDGSDYSVTRLSDDTVVYGPGALPADLDGVRLTLASGTPAAGDSFLLQPTRFGARDLGVEIQNTNEIAMAAPVRTQAAIANTGSALINEGVVNAPPPTDPDLTDTVTLTFTTTGQFDVVNVTDGTTLASGVAYTPGADITYNGWTVRISGAPAAGDVFTVERNTDGIGDNRNGLALAGLQNTGVLDSGNSNYEDAYARLVADAGTRTREGEVNLAAQQVIQEQAVASRDSVSGVNLDEEAADLLRLQQAYQASAKVINVADTIFQSLLEAVS